MGKVEQKTWVIKMHIKIVLKHQTSMPKRVFILSYLTCEAYKNLGNPQASS